MKTTSRHFLAVSLTAVAAIPWSAWAAPLYKIDNTDDLNLLTSWSTASDAQTPNPVSFDPADIWYFNDSTMLGSKTVSLGADITIAGIGLDNTTPTNPGNTYNVVINSGGTLTLNGGTISGTGVDGGSGYSTAGIVINRSVGGTLTINANVAIGANQQWVTSRALTVTGGINLNTRTLSFNTAGTGNVMTLSGVISGTGNVNKAAGTGTLALANTDNSFSGTVTLVGGNTTITRLADGGNNSSLGNGSGNILLNGANLVYVGTSSGTTNRAIEMRAGSGILNNSATDAITLTAPNVIHSGTASARTLTLNGTNAGDNTFNPILGDSGTSPNISRLQKNGGGRWIVTGTQAYTGATIINQGTLVVGGGTVLGGASGSTADESNIWFSSVQANGALHFETVANLGPADQIRFRNTGGTAGNGGALVYTGTTEQTLSKTIQCDSSIGIRLESNSVGGKLTFNGPFTQTNRALYLGGTGIGDNTLATAFTGTGGIVKRDAGTWILSAANTYTGNTVVNDGTLAVNSSGSLRFRPTTNGVNNAVSGSSTATLTFTGAVSLDLSAANTTAGNSWNLFNLGSFSGPAPTLTPAAVTSTTLGSFTETSPGVWELPVTGAKWVFTESDGNLVYSAGFAAWAAANAPGQTINQDHDDDGVPNGVEFFMGLSGNGFTATPSPDASNLISWPKGASYSGTYGTDYAVQISSDLGISDPWSDVAEVDLTIDADSVDYDLDTAPAGTRKFARLKVTGP